MQSVRGQHLLHLDLLWVPCHTNMIGPDRVMGVTSVGSHESERFGEGSDPEIKNTHDTVAHHREEEVNEDQEREVDQCDVAPGVGDSHGGFGSASFTECLNLAAQSTNRPSAPFHSEGKKETTVRMTNPPQVKTPNVGQKPPQDSTSAHDPPTEDATQRKN